VTTGIDVLDSSVQEVNEWLNDMEARLGTTDRKRAYNALKIALHALRDHVGRDNAVHLAAQLPLMIKGIFYENWQPARTSARTTQDFVQRGDGAAARGAAVDIEAAIRAGLDVLVARVNPAQSAKLVRLFPEELRELWPATVH